jgi:hypothetical protein
VSHSQENLEQRIAEGWRFRIKTSRGHRYITRRRGGQERSLGRYTDHLWKQIQALIQSPTQTATELDNVKTTLEAIKQEIRQVKAELDAVNANRELTSLHTIRELIRKRMQIRPCAHLTDDGFCSSPYKIQPSRTSSDQKEVRIGQATFYLINVMRQTEECFGCPFERRTVVLEIPQTLTDFDKYAFLVKTPGNEPDQIIPYRDIARSLRPADQEQKS